MGMSCRKGYSRGQGRGCEEDGCIDHGGIRWGILDARMKKTPEKLSQMEGNKFCFVRTDAIAN